MSEEIQTQDLHNETSVDGVSEVNNNSVNTTDSPTCMEIEEERVRQYPSSHKGPFVVYLRSKDGERIKPLTTTKLLFSSFRQKLRNVEQVNAFKLRIICASRDAANELPTAPVLSNFRVYVPASEVETDGVISLELEEEIKEVVSAGRGVFNNSLIPDVKVLSVFRLSKNVPGEDNNPTRQPSTAVRVTFEGTLLPHRLLLGGLRIPIRLYHPLEMYCNKCHRTGHTQKYCTNQPKCSKCGEAHLTSSCTSTEPVKECVLCKTEHSNSRAACPKIKLADERKFNKAKKQQTVSYAEAVKHFSPNSYMVLQVDDEGSDSCSVDDNVSVGTKKRKRVEKCKAKTPKETAQRLTAPGSSNKNLYSDDLEPQAEVNAKRKAGSNKSPHRSPNYQASSSIDWWRSIVLNTLQSLAESLGFSTFVHQTLHMIVNFIFDHLSPHIRTLISQLFSTDRNCQ